MLIAMELDFGNVRKPVRQLRKTLKRFAENPSTNEVHDLRTRARRLEALVGKVARLNKTSRKNLLKSLKPLRKAAGAVRDMDVLATNVRRLATHDNSAELLLAYLHDRRLESAEVLSKEVKDRRKKVRALLDAFQKKLQKQFETGHANAVVRKPLAETATELLDQLSSWPSFDAPNLHDYRIKVKKLQDVLKVTGGADPKFASALDNVKNSIGDWHDWQQLALIARQVLGKSKRRAALTELERVTRQKLQRALVSAQSIKTRFLGPYRDEVQGAA